MLGYGKSVPLRVQQRRLFVEQFKKDLEFFKLFFLLVNKSCIIKHMGVLWSQDGPAAQFGLSNVLDTQDALLTSCSRFVRCDPNLDPDFCRIVNDYGRHEVESCGMSDRAAEKRCRETGETQIYTCHAGLMDIAVPVISSGQYIATLLCGQALGEAPSEAGFRQVRKKVSRLSYIDLDKLEGAYWKAPVSTREDVETAKRLLESFAEYVATSWGRLSDLVRDQHRTMREAQLLHKEFAHLILDGAPVERSALRELMGKVGFTLAPNRVLVVQLEPQEQYPEGTASFDVGFTAALQEIEEICDTQENTVGAYLRKRGISVFFHDQGSRALDSISYQAQGLAQRIAEGVKGRCDLRVRVGIGGVKDDVRSLVQSYDEACMALAQSAETMAVYQSPIAPIEDLTAAAERVCACLSARKLGEARVAIDSLRLLANRRLGEGPASLGVQRQFFCSTLYSMCFCAKQLGADRELVDQVLWSVDTDIHGALTRSELHGAYMRFAERILEEIRKLYCSRQDKLVERACRMIDQLIERADANSRISSTHVAVALGVSVSHLGRTFKQVRGMTFERFVMQRRVDLAKRLLLDPSYNVSQAAEKCGFSDPAYFARVFRKVSGCTPKEYMQDPLGRERQGPGFPQEISDADPRLLTIPGRDRVAS